jgi:hypothetical protein
MAETRITSLADFNEPFNIVFSIGDIRDISFGSCDKSYALDIPLTKLNKNLLKFITQSDVKSEPSEPVSIYVDGQLIMKGKLIVLSYDEYSVKVIISADDWMDALAAQMSTLDLTSFNHTLNNANVIASWTAAYPMFRYPMIDFGVRMSAEGGALTGWFPNDFIPMLSIAQIIRKLLPYTIVSDWLDSSYIKDLFILGRETIAEDSFIQNRGLAVNVDNVNDNDATHSVATYYDVSLSKNLLFYFETKDEAAAWANDTYYIPVAGTYRFIATIVLRNSAHGNANLTINDEAVILNIRVGGVSIASQITAAYSGTELIENITYTLDTSYYSFAAGDEVTVAISMHCAATLVSGGSQSLSIGTKVTSTLALIWGNANKYPGIGSTINLSNYLPDMTEIDFLAAIRDIFNLRFWMDKRQNMLHIEPWDSFISDKVVDLSEFVDYASLPAELISPNYCKTIQMKWTDDMDDQAFVEYMKENTVSQGLVNINLTSLFTIQDIDMREHPFASIIEAYGSVAGDTKVPRIWNSVPQIPYTTYDRMVNFVTRLVHWDGLTNGFTWYLDGVAQTAYPKISGVQWLDLYKNYWQKFFHWVDKGKLYTITIKVNPSFLSQFLTEINDSKSEGFRPKYKISINGVENYFALQTITTDGMTAELQLILL